jgi:hypothetical protein
VLEIFKLPGPRVEPAVGAPPYGESGSGAPAPGLSASLPAVDGSPAPADGIGVARDEDLGAHDGPARDIETGEFTRVR